MYLPLFASFNWSQRGADIGVGKMWQCRILTVIGLFMLSTVPRTTGGIQLCVLLIPVHSPSLMYSSFNHCYIYRTDQTALFGTFFCRHAWNYAFGLFNMLQRETDALSSFSAKRPLRAWRSAKQDVYHWQRKEEKGIITMFLCCSVLRHAFWACCSFYCSKQCPVSPCFHHHSCCVRWLKAWPVTMIDSLSDSHCCMLI